MKPGNYPWSEIDLQILIDMKADGATHSDIGKVLGRSKNAVAGKASNVRRMLVTSTVKPTKPQPACPLTQTRGERLTALMFGDPPPGRSALDHRNSH